MLALFHEKKYFYYGTYCLLTEIYLLQETTKFDTWQILKYQKTKEKSFVFNKYLHDIVHLH